MSKWIKKGEYYATNQAYSMTWLDPKDRYTLYYKKEHLISGSRQECLDEYWKHFRLPVELKNNNP